MRTTTTQLSTRSFGTHPGPFAPLLLRAPSANSSSRNAAPLPLVLAPGMLMTGAIFDDTLARLPRSLSARVVAFNHHTEASGSSVESMAEALLASVPGDGAFALCGFSMGGYVAMEVLRRAPHRVARLALISSQARADSPSALRFRRRVLALAEAEGVEVIESRAIESCDACVLFCGAPSRVRARRVRSSRVMCVLFLAHRLACERVACDRVVRCVSFFGAARKSPRPATRHAK